MRILIFGPNGSGKGTQSSILVKTLGLAHIESGGIFRDNAKRGTDLGKKARAFTEQGKLVPDSITIPMIIDRLSQDDCAQGWVLDGFPRNPSQAQALLDALESRRAPIDVVIVIELDRATAKARLLGRATCPNGHPNNTAIAAIAPVKGNGQDICATCGEPVTIRKDDIDEAAIDIRLDIYFDTQNGTSAAIQEVENWALARQGVTVIRVDGRESISQVRDQIFDHLPKA